MNIEYIAFAQEFPGPIARDARAVELAEWEIIVRQFYEDEKRHHYSAQQRDEHWNQLANRIAARRKELGDQP